MACLRFSGLPPNLKKKTKQKKHLTPLLTAGLLHTSAEAKHHTVYGTGLLKKRKKKKKNKKNPCVFLTKGKEKSIQILRGKKLLLAAKQSDRQELAFA